MKPATYSAYNSNVRSANPNPVCRKGGCGEPAVEGSEWCAGHDIVVRLDQERADAQVASYRRRGRPLIRPVDA